MSSLSKKYLEILEISLYNSVGIPKTLGRSYADHDFLADLGLLRREQRGYKISIQGIRFLYDRHNDKIQSVLIEIAKFFYYNRENVDNFISTQSLATQISDKEDQHLAKTLLDNFDNSIETLGALSSTLPIQIKVKQIFFARYSEISDFLKYFRTIISLDRQITFDLICNNKLF